MSLGRVWSIECDESRCSKVYIIGKAADRWDAGMSANDHGWRAAPDIKQTYCPKHYSREDENDA